MYPINILGVIEITKNSFIGVEDFEEMFGEKEVHEFQYNYFESHESATKSWKLIFDEWKQKGILN